MPYIKQADKTRLETEDATAKSVGELNYLITSVIKAYLEDYGLSYKTINDILGALEGAKAEFYRRVAIPYETKKIKENGDVY